MMDATPDFDRYLADPTALIRERLILDNGRPFGDTMADFQERFFQAIFANVDGIPAHRLVYDERRRGESKTEDCAAAGLADLLTGPPGHTSYAVAGDEDQAGLILDSVRGFKARSSILADVSVLKSTVHNQATDAKLHVLSSDARTNYGVRPRKVFFDELSLQVDERLWTAMWTAIGKKATSQMVAVSMAGWDFASLGWRIRQQALQSAGRYYFATREGSELASWLSPADMDEQRDTLHPADFARFWECRWTEPKGSWITAEMYAAAEKGTESRTAAKSRAVGFIDVGLVHDPTVIAVCHKEGDAIVLDTLRTFQGSRNEPVSMEAVENEVRTLTGTFHVQEWVFEAPQAAASVQRLANSLSASVTLQYPTAESVARLFGNLYQLFANRRLVIFPHERLKREALSLVTKTIAGRLKVVESSSVHQDHVVALGGAALLLAGDGEGPLVWSPAMEAEWRELDAKVPVLGWAEYSLDGPNRHDELLKIRHELGLDQVQYE
jgi:hypothetical protein